jgi:outer membrane receptor protein involved in Fe transport
MTQFGVDRRASAGRRAGLLAGLSILAFASAAAAQTAPAPKLTPDAAASTEVEQVVVTASRVNMLGTAETASQGSVTAKELDLRPIYRPGQLLETTPGLVVTAHSGEGKANQYLVRGFNLDHGTDIANFVDDMPVNRPTNAHGQGYSDVNFYIPEVASGLDFTLLRRRRRFRGGGLDPPEAAQ